MNTLMRSTDTRVVFAEPADDWRNQVVVAYQHDQPRAIAAMRTDLACRLHMLIDRRIAHDSIHTVRHGDLSEKRQSG